MDPSRTLTKAILPWIWGDFFANLSVPNCPDKLYPRRVAFTHGSYKPIGTRKGSLRLHDRAQFGYCGTYDLCVCCCRNAGSANLYNIPEFVGISVGIFII